ncbi:MAG: YbhB/YbcL family Raf kinase inhibitor-like protein [Chloroflexi bacterium]|nr:YbhB/YbcL family Raf kinase inhibitor-like protein [Chloroflexota bacterium]
MRVGVVLLACVVGVVIAGCGGERGPTPTPALTAPGATVGTLTLTSPAFPAGGEIPRKYTCDGENVSPPLEWGAPPQGTQSLVLIMDDPDAPAGVWDHWLLYNLPADARGLPEGIAPDAARPDGSRHGANSWGRLGYGGPCPPSGTHRYFFRLYALDTTLNLAAGANKAQVLAAMAGHVLAQGELMGTYRR